MPSFTTLLACWLSGQISAAQWEMHKQDELFAAWLRKQGYAV